jgi:inhibitor of KinA sporulation pathway (predicted exonuclease)
MGKRLDKILVVDVESTCWLAGPPPGEESEIVEIGLCLLDVATGRRELKRSILVRPERSTISPFCTELTTLTQKQVNEGVSFAQACALLRDEYSSERRVWASYGDYDRRQFARQCRARTIPYPFGPSHVNVKNLFALSRALDQEVNLVQALKMQGWELEGTYHRGDDDAWNVARILAAILCRSRPPDGYCQDGEAQR